MCVCVWGGGLLAAAANDGLPVVACKEAPAFLHTAEACSSFKLLNSTDSKHATGVLKPRGFSQ